MRLPYGLWFRNGSGFLLPLSSPRSANYATATYYIPRTPIPGMRRMAAIDRALRQWWNSVAPVFGYRRNDSPRNFPSNRSPRVPLGARASRVRVTTAISPCIRSGGTRERGDVEIYAVIMRSDADVTPIVSLLCGEARSKLIVALRWVLSACHPCW